MKSKFKEPPIKATPAKIKAEIKEYKLSWAGKLFFAGAAGYILGKAITPAKMPIKIRGTKKQMQTVINAVVNSKKFQMELNKPGATIDSVIEKLRIRNISKNQFKALVGKSWPI